MKVTSERIENCQAKVIVELDAAETAEKLRQTANKISKQFTVPGYRRGKAPVQAVIRTFGREAFRQEALEGFGQELYDSAIQESGYELYQPGELQEVQWDPFRMTILLPLKPELDLGDYRTVRVSAEPEPVTDEQVAQYLAELQEKHSQWVPVERPAAPGDQLVLDATGKVDDLVVLELAGTEGLLDTEAQEPLPGFHAQIVGMSAGEEKSFTLTYPADHEQKDAAGKEATFTVKVHSVKEKDVPALDDELATMVGDYDTIEDLKASVRESLGDEAQKTAEAGYLDKVLEAIIQGATRIEYPPVLVDQEADAAVERMERRMASAGFQLDTYLQSVGLTRERYKLGLRPEADGRARKRLVLLEVARLEGLKAGDEEVAAEVKRLSELVSEDEEMAKFLTGSQGHLSVAEDLLLAKAQERVVQIGKGEAPPLETAVSEIATAPAGPRNDEEGEEEPVAGSDSTLPEPEASAGPDVAGELWDAEVS